MPTEKKKKTWAAPLSHLGLYLPPDLKVAVCQLADADGRKVSDWMRRLLEREVKAAEESSASAPEKG